MRWEEVSILDWTCTSSSVSRSHCLTPNQNHNVCWDKTTPWPFPYANGREPRQLGGSLAIEVHWSVEYSTTVSYWYLYQYCRSLRKRLDSSVSDRSVLTQWLRSQPKSAAAFAEHECRFHSSNLTYAGCVETTLPIQGRVNGLLHSWSNLRSIWHLPPYTIPLYYCSIRWVPSLCSTLIPTRDSHGWALGNARYSDVCYDVCVIVRWHSFVHWTQMPTDYQRSEIAYILESLYLSETHDFDDAKIISTAANRLLEQ